MRYTVEVEAIYRENTKNPNTLCQHLETIEGLKSYDEALRCAQNKARWYYERYFGLIDRQLCYAGARFIDENGEYTIATHGK